MTDWVRDYYDNVDGLEAEGVARHFAADGTFQLGNFPPATGRAEIAAGNQAFFDTIEGMRHDFTGRYTDGHVDVVEADVTYTAKGGAKVTVPGIAVLERDHEGLITASRSYIDMGPLRELSSGQHDIAASPETFVKRFIAAVDTLDVGKVLPFFAKSGSFTYGNNAPMVGLDEIRAGLEPFHASLGGLSHVVRNCYPCGPRVIVAEYIATYTRLDGQDVTLPGIGVFELADGLVEAYRVYADVAPVFA